MIIKGKVAFSYKEELKENGYYFNGFNRKGNVWVKKIKVSQLHDEKNFLNSLLGIEYKIEGTPTKTKTK